MYVGYKVNRMFQNRFIMYMAAREVLNQFHPFLTPQTVKDKGKGISISQGNGMKQIWFQLVSSC